MNTRLAIATALIGSLACSTPAWSKDKDHDQKREIVETHDFEDFDQIEVLGVYELDIRLGDEFSIRTEATRDEAETLKIRQKGSLLILDNERSNTKEWGQNNRNSAILTVVTMPKLVDLEIQGVATGRVEAFDGGRVDVDIEGVVGDLELSGRCDMLSVDMAGVGQLDAEDLICEEVDADLEGVGEMVVHATRKVRASADGIGKISVHGDPKDRDVDDSFMAKVRFK